MSTPEAQETSRWFRGIASEFVAALEPLEHRDGGWSLEWHKSGVDYIALCKLDGSLFMHAERIAGEWDEWADTIKARRPAEAAKVRAFYGWSV